MKLDHIKEQHLLEAAALIDYDGIPGKYFPNQYWVVINNKEYPFKYLLRIAHQLTPGHNDEWLDFQSHEVYRDYITKEIKLPINYHPEWFTFFLQEELESFNTIVKRKYKKDNKADQRLGLKNLPLFLKTEFWAKSLLIDGFFVSTDRKWQISGTFKPYTWARIYRHGNQDKKIFFTVGISAKEKSLVYKIDCLYSQTNKDKALSSEKVARFKKFLQGTNTEWRSIPFEDIPFYNWDRLIIESKRFIEDNIHLYDEVVKYVWQEKQIAAPAKAENTLILDEVPINGYKELPQRNPLFKGINKDFIKTNNENKARGDAGEALVIKYERNLLLAANKPDLADNVVKVKDGKGYDILSFFPDGNEKHIEVKTTTGEKLKPFPISWTEVEYIKKRLPNYRLYRLYNYDPLINNASFFIMKDHIFEQLFLQELNYDAYVKNRE